MQHHMSDHFVDRLEHQSKIKGAPVCVGIDPVWDCLPLQIRGDQTINNQLDAQTTLIVTHVHATVRESGRVPGNLTSKSIVCRFNYLEPVRESGLSAVRAGGPAEHP